MRHRMRSVKAPNMVIGTEHYREKMYGVWGAWRTYATYSITPSTSSYPHLSYESCWDTLNPGPPYKTGGTFNKWTFTTDCYVPKLKNVYLSQVMWGTYQHRYTGSFVWSPVDLTSYMLPWGPVDYKTPGASPSVISATDGRPNNGYGDVSSYGTVAWKKFRPGKPIADLGVFIGELRDLPRQLKTTARVFKDAYVLRFGKNPKRKAKIAADHWLNLQFGWLPFVKDLQKFYKAYTKCQATIDYIRRNNGKWIRRGGPVDASEGDTEVLATQSGNRLYPQLLSYYFPAYPNTGSWSVSRVTTSKVWHRGHYRYFIPNIESEGWSANAARRLWGAELTPSLVWELVPWSWLVDWATNVGDIFTNASNAGLADNLVMKNGWLMGTKRTSILFKTSSLMVQPVTYECEFALERKAREAGSEFGFNLTEESFSARQWSILGALGVSRLH